eukprot:gnl/Trimastix_PCT/1430.p1 GENE.gnl/Trimastix_PCT/1430~~gnl/Trimastix_PCT/1430.p1  ORF type:complete len:347 (+),score=90.19 gnl/Trimastix_PCT/1430:52-1092(+)
MSGMSIEKDLKNLNLSDDDSVPANCTLDDLEPLEILGTGTFGVVKMCRCRLNERHYALKIMSKDKIRRLRQVRHIRNERDLLLGINHPRIVNLYRTFQDEEYLYMMMEYLPGGELFFHLRKRVNFPVETVRYYSAQIVLAFEYLHSHNFTYRDLKPENLLLDFHGQLKLTDFGFAKELTGDMMTYTLCGTPEYLAPEIILNTGHSFGVDWWAVGILIYEMLAGHPPFYDDNPFRIYEKIVHQNILFPQSFDPNAKDLVLQLLQRDTTRRLGNIVGGAQTIKRHPFFAGVDWDAMLKATTPAPIVPELRNKSDPSIYLTARSEEEDDLEQHEEDLPYDDDPNAFEGF